MKKSFILCVAILSTVLILLTSCGVDNSNAPQDTTTADDTETEAPETTVESLNIPETWYLEGERYPDEYWNKIFASCAKWAENFEGYYIKTPVTHTETVDGCQVTVEFFKEYYKIGEPLQIRITVANNTDADIEYNANSDGCQLSSDGGESGIALCPLNGTQYNYQLEFFKPATLKAGESVVFERMFLPNPEKLPVGHNLTFKFYSIRTVNLKLEYICP